MGKHQGLSLKQYIIIAAYYCISQEICTRFCYALLCCGYAIVHNEYSHEVFIHIHQGCFAGTGTIVRLPQCQWSKPDGYGKISQCITITKHSKAKTVCIFLGIYCISLKKNFTFPFLLSSWKCKIHPLKMRDVCYIDIVGGIRIFFIIFFGVCVWGGGGGGGISSLSWKQINFEFLD